MSVVITETLLPYNLISKMKIRIKMNLLSIVLSLIKNLTAFYKFVYNIFNKTNRKSKGNESYIILKVRLQFHIVSYFLSFSYSQKKRKAKLIFNQKGDGEFCAVVIICMQEVDIGL